MKQCSMITHGTPVYCIIDDLRFENEAAWVKQCGGTIFYIEPMHGKQKNPHAEHKSERLDDLVYYTDHYIMNMADTIQELYEDCKPKFDLIVKNFQREEKAQVDKQAWKEEAVEDRLKREYAEAEQWKKKKESKKAFSIATALNIIASAAHRHSKTQGFWDRLESDHEDAVITTKLMLANSELCEALEVLRDEHAIECINPKTDLPHLVEEIADACIRLFDLAGYLDSRRELALGTFGEILLQKMEYNKGRKTRHGRRF